MGARALAKAVASALARQLGGVGAGAPAWSPSSLFANGEQGVWYDQSDFSTMFQDSAGTTPVTAVEQPVGKILDKSGRGNHASQATSAARPVLSARKNLLLQSEALGTSPWSGSNTTVTVGQAANASGQMTLCKVEATTSAATILTQRVNGSGSVGGNTFRFLARKGSGATDCNAFGLYNNTTTTLLALFTVNYDTGVVSHAIGSGATMVALGGGLREVKLSQTTGIATGNDLTIYGGFIGDAETAGEFAYIGEYQLEANTAFTRYQRVNTAADYDTAGFPHYLKFDGVDDFSQVGPFAAGTLTSTMDVFVLMRRNSSAGFCLLAPSDNSVAYGFALDGNANGAIQDGGYVNGRAWVNGVELTGGAAVTADQLHDALPVGKWHVVELHNVKMDTLTNLRIGGAGIGFPLNGVIAEVILAPAQSAEERTKVREYLAAKAGITLP